MSLMFGWEAWKSEMTCLNAVCWLGSSPPLRQQNQRIWTGPPGGTVAGPLLGGGSLTAAAAQGGASEAGGLAAGGPPPGGPRRANAAIKAPGQEGRPGTAPPPVAWCPPAV